MRVLRRRTRRTSVGWRRQGPISLRPVGHIPNEYYPSTVWNYISRSWDVSADNIMLSLHPAIPNARLPFWTACRTSVELYDLTCSWGRPRTTAVGPVLVHCRRSKAFCRVLLNFEGAFRSGAVASTVRGQDYNIPQSLVFPLTPRHLPWLHLQHLLRGRSRRYWEHQGS